MTVIKSIEPQIVRIPTKSNYRMAGMESGGDASFALLVRLETDDGIVGWGETFLTPGWYAADTPAGMVWIIKTIFAPQLKGVSVFDIETVEQRMHKAWQLGNLFAKSALEIAVRDAAARKLEIPLHALLGGAYRDRFAVSAGIGTDTPELMAKSAVQYKDRGFSTIKLKIGTPDELDMDVARVKEVRDAVGPDIAVRLDGNGVYSIPQAIRLCREIDRYDIEHIEQPVAGDNIKGMAEIRQAIGIPLMADESVHDMKDALSIIEHRAADVIKLKVSKCGGLGPSRRIASVCHAAGIEVTLGNGLNTSVLATAELQLACSCAAIMPAGEFIGPDKLVEDIVETPMTIENGEALLPKSPGLGVEISQDRLKKYAVSLN